MNPTRVSLLALLALLLAMPAAQAQQDPVSWSARLDPRDARAGEAARVLVTGRIADTWLVYSMTETGGPIPLSIELAPGTALVAAGKAIQPPPKKKYDEGFEAEVEYHSGEVVFAVPVKLAAGLKGPQKAAVKIRYQACDPRLCLPPKTVETPVTFTVAAGPARPERTKPSTAVPPQPAAVKSDGVEGEGGTGAGVAATTGAGAAAADGDFSDRVRQAQASGLGTFLWLALTMGFLALLTPCVFPMVPITVSFFSKQQDATGSKNLGGALAYCMGIISTFTGLGLLLTVVFGASGIQQFATNPWINLGMATLFVLLALNLFGVYEIEPPGWLVNRIGSKARSRGGRFAGPMLMGLAFTLTSFTCTVPFVGTLLVATTQGSPLWPVVGMLAFSTAFASPFFLLALFPSWLARLPKSGSWLVSVKAYMGFLELAAAVKFLSNADLVWQTGVLTRPVFLSVWSTIALVAGLYLMGWLRLPHGETHVMAGPFRRGLGVATVVMGVWCLAAIGGRTSLGEMEAFLPPASYGAPRGTAVAHGGIQWIEDYDEAVAKAEREGKPLFINFTGYTCTNCRWMEANIFPRPEVLAAMERFVPVELFTDGQGPGYERNKRLQQERFGTVAVPLYVVVTPDGQKLGEFPGLTRNPEEFVRFLQKASTAAQTVLRPPDAATALP